MIAFTFSKSQDLPELQLFAAPPILNGRSISLGRTNADIDLSFPKNLDPNRQLTYELSNHQASLEIIEGDLISVQNLSRKSLINLNNQNIDFHDTATVPCDFTSTLQLSASISVRLRPLPTEKTAPFYKDVYSELTNENLSIRVGKHGLDGILIEPSHPGMRNVRCFAIVINSIALGPVFDGGTFPLPGGRVRVVYLQNQFWLHNSAADVTPIVRGNELKQNMICPLAPGTEIILNGHTILLTTSLKPM